MENVIKNLNIKPMLERAEYERVEPPKNGESINIQITDEVTVKLISDEIARVSVARSAVSNPERLFKLYVETKNIMTSSKILLNISKKRLSLGL